MYTIEFRDIRKTYGLYNNKWDKIKEALSLREKKYHKEFEALKGISFSITKGECVGIIGLNGSGKSTTLKILSGITKPTSGDVKINGKVSALLELGAGFNPEYTGIENIYLNSTLQGYTRKETDEKLQDIIEFADIGDFIYQPVKSYSTGMFVRLAFAVAINIKPEILVIDEALSVGDVFFQNKCYKKIKELSGEATVVMVSHDLNAMTKFCERIIVLDRGNLVFDGEPTKAIAEYYKLKQGKLEHSAENNVLEIDDFSDFKIPDKEIYSGNMEVLIEKYFYSVNGIPFIEKCEVSDVINISLLVEAKNDIENIIVGYQVRDKYGNEIFGDTNLTSPVKQYLLCRGKNRINISFIWPEVREGDYFITLGIGRGSEVLNQVEECWINNAIHVYNSVFQKTIFGIFNQEIKDFEIKQL